MYCHTGLFLCFSGAVLFTTQPRNKSVNYGEIVEFECNIRVDDGTDHYSLKLFIGFRNVIENEVFNRLDSREFFADVNDTLGKVWILINSRTIPLFNYFWCRVFYDAVHFETSNVAFIDIKYPECPSDSPPSQTNTISPSTTSESISTAQPTSVHVHIHKLASTSVAFQPCSCHIINNNGMHVGFINKLIITFKYLIYIIIL